MNKIIQLYRLYIYIVKFIYREREKEGEHCGLLFSIGILYSTEKKWTTFSPIDIEESQNTGWSTRYQREIDT